MIEDRPNSGPCAVITGGAGFLGSHFCERLIAEGFRVICLDNYLTGTLDNLRPIMENPNLTLMQADVTEPIRISDPVDYVLHFASPASPKDYLQHPIHTLKVGALGTYHTLGLAQAKGAVFLLASTSEVYGDPEVNPQPETYWGKVNPVGSRSVYDEAKRFAEAITMAYHRQNGVDIRIARIFNCYGPRMRLDDGRAMPNFIVQALRGEPLTIYGDGTQTRSFCYLDDMIEGLFRLLTFEPEASIRDMDRIFNIGAPEEITMLELVKYMKELTGSRSEVVFGPLPDDDPKVRRPDICRAERALGWSPKVSLEAGLQRTICYFRNRLEQG